jgi:glucan phosphoethanolaminetransferase (alkaline phosphatase superfamily)
MRTNLHSPPVKPRISSLSGAEGTLRPITYLVLFHLSFSLIYIVAFARLFTYSKKVVLLHLLLIAGAMLLLLLLFTALALRRPTQTSFGIRLLFSGVAAACFSWLLLLYVADAVSNYLWHDSVSYELVKHNVADLSLYLRVIQLNPNWIYPLLVVTLLFIFFVYFKLSPPIQAGCDQLATNFKRHGQLRGRKRAALIAIALGLLLAYGSAAAILLIKLRGSGRYHGEPLVYFFFPTVFTEGQADDARTLSERQLRAEYTAPPSFERKNVILIIVDSLRADRMSAYGYQRDTTPFLNELMRDGNAKKVELVHANCPFSTGGILSILTSRNADMEHEANLKLYDLLYDQGYKVYLILSGEQTGLPYLRRSYGKSMNLFFDGSSSSTMSPTDDRVIFEGLDKVPPYRGIPTFFYFHLMSTHRLGVEFEGFQKYQPVPRERRLQLLHTYDAIELSNVYDNRVMQADDVIRRLFDALAQKQYLENSLVVIVSDHGESLGEHGNFGHGKHLYQEELRIPLLIYDKSGAVYQNLEYATQIDVAPTIFARLGLPIPRSWEGRSLLAPPENRFSYHQTFETVFSKQQSSKIVPGRASVIYRTQTAVYKYIHSEKEQKEELYELLTDPGERQNVIATIDQSLLSKMREVMARHVANVD